MKQVDFGEPKSFFDHVYLGCTQRECETSKVSVDISKKMPESRMSAGGKEKYFTQKIEANISSWSCDKEGHAKKANKTQQLHKVAASRIDDHQFKEEEIGSVGELSKVCSHIVLKCLYLARIGRLDIFWCVNKLAHAITKWTDACDKRLARLISYIHHTSEFK